MSIARLLPIAAYPERMATFRGTIRSRETREITVEVPDGGDAIGMLEAEVPEGGQLIAMRRDNP